MRIPTVLLCFAILLAGCSSRASADRERSRAGDDSAAHKAGHAAYGVAQDAKHAAAAAGKKVWKAGKEAREGWKEAQREQKTTNRR